MEQGVIITVAGEALKLLSERCLYWLREETLLAADLHWGKAEVFQKAGVSISSRVLEDDLARLTQAIEKTGAKRFVVLGDLIHAPKGVTPEVTDCVTRWRESHANLEILLIRGNHDRRFELPKSWRIESVQGAFTTPPFLLTHDDVSERKGLHQIAGHVHPVLTIRGAGDSLRLPCFAVGADSMVVPAFSAFTGGFEIRRNDWKNIYVIAENSVIEV